MTDNEKLFDAGMDRAKKIIYNHLTDFLMNICEETVNYAMSHHSGFRNFTGNTHTGYACGVYVEGKLVGIVSSADKAKPPVRVKVTAGETAFLDPDYDGAARKFTGKIETDRGFGQHYAAKFLNAHKPPSDKGIAFAMTTGTEYSEYLEIVYHADVLTGTFSEIPKMLYNILKPLP